MPKFSALFNIKSLIVPFIEKDENGNIVRDESIVFNKGLNTANGFMPAYYSTTDPDRLRFLRSDSGNAANGGNSFEEVKEETVAPAAPAKKQEAAKAEAPAPEVKTEAPAAEETNPEGTVYADVTTVNEASNILRGLYPELKVRDVNTRDKVNTFSATKNISFPNL